MSATPLEHQPTPSPAAQPSNGKHAAAQTPPATLPPTGNGQPPTGNGHTPAGSVQSSAGNTQPPVGLNEQQLWSRVTDMLGDGHIRLGRHWSYNLRNDPKRLGFVLARYKFAARMLGKDRHIFEMGCSEGIGCPILAETARLYYGVDLDEPAIATAQQNWASPTRQFVCDDFLGKKYGTFDAVVSLDVIEHIHVDYEDLFMQTMFDNLGPDGIGVIGTPNVTSSAYASAASQRGHINLYDSDRLAAALHKVFHNVFRFGMNDEVAHTGFAPMSHYLIHVGCYKRERYGA